MLYTLPTGLSYLVVLKYSNRFPADGQGQNLQISLCVRTGKLFRCVCVFSHMSVDNRKVDNSSKLSLQMSLTI